MTKRGRASRFGSQAEPRNQFKGSYNIEQVYCMNKIAQKLAKSTAEAELLDIGSQALPGNQFNSADVVIA